MKNVISSFANCVSCGRINLEEVPLRYRDEVKAYLEQENKDGMVFHNDSNSSRCTNSPQSD